MFNSFGGEAYDHHTPPCTKNAKNVRAKEKICWKNFNKDSLLPKATTMHAFGGSIIFF